MQSFNYGKLIYGKRNSVKLSISSIILTSGSLTSNPKLKKELNWSVFKFPGSIIRKSLLNISWCWKKYGIIKNKIRERGKYWKLKRKQDI